MAIEPTLAENRDAYLDTLTRYQTEIEKGRRLKARREALTIEFTDVKAAFLAWKADEATRQGLRDRLVALTSTMNAQLAAAATDAAS